MMQGQQEKQAGQNALQENVINQAVQKLMELKNASEGLAKILGVVKPESQALMMPILQAGKAIEAELQELIQKAKPKVPPQMMGQQGQPPPMEMGGGAGNGVPNPAEGMPPMAA